MYVPDDTGSYALVGSVSSMTPTPYSLATQADVLILALDPHLLQEC